MKIVANKKNIKRDWWNLYINFLYKESYSLEISLLSYEIASKYHDYYLKCFSEKTFHQSIQR